MKQKAFLILLIFSTLILFGPNTLFAKDIVILSQFPLSGAHGSLPEMGWGFIDAWNWFNDEAGGVGGQKVKWFMEDMRYDATVEVATFNKYCSEYSKDEFLMATGYITGALKPLIKKVNEEEKIPWVDGSFSEEIFGKEGGPSKYPYYYSLGATYGDQMKVLVKWIADNYKGPGKPKVAFVNSPTGYGRDGLPEAISYAKEKGVDVVAKIEYPYTATDATNECMEIRKSKAQYIIYHGFTGQQSVTALFLKTLKKICPKVQFTGTKYMGGVVALMINREAYDGVVYADCWPSMDAIPRSAARMENPMTKLIHDMAKKYRPEEYKKGIKEKGAMRNVDLYFIGALYAFIVQQALLEAHKAGDLTRAGINKALENMVWDFKGMFGGQTFSYRSHMIPMLRLHQAKVKMIEMGKKMVPTGGYVPISDWINTKKIKW